MYEESAQGTDRREFLKGAAMLGGLAALTAGGTLVNADVAEAATKKKSPYAQAQSKVDYYKTHPLVKASAKWQKVYAFEPGNSRMIEGMNFSPDGTLWFIDIGYGRVMNIKNGKLNIVHEDPKTTPNGAKFIDEDTLLIADRNLGLCTYTISTGEYKAQKVDGAKFNILNDLVLAGDGKGAYITDPGKSDYLKADGAIWYVDYSGYKEGKFTAEKWADGLKYPNGITISPDGMFLYVAEFNTNSIINVPSKAYTKALDTPYVVARLQGGHGPDGVTTDSKGNIYAAHLHAKEVAVVDNQGWPVQNIQLPVAANTDPSNLCLHGGYLYVCEFADGVIWRIKINAKPNPLE